MVLDGVFLSDSKYLHFKEIYMEAVAMKVYILVYLFTQVIKLAIYFHLVSLVIN